VTDKLVFKPIGNEEVIAVKLIKVFIHGEWRPNSEITVSHSYLYHSTPDGFPDTCPMKTYSDSEGHVDYNFSIAIEGSEIMEVFNTPGTEWRLDDSVSLSDDGPFSEDFDPSKYAGLTVTITYDYIAKLFAMSNNQFILPTEYRIGIRAGSLTNFIYLEMRFRKLVGKDPSGALIRLSDNPLVPDPGFGLIVPLHWNNLSGDLCFTPDIRYNPHWKQNIDEFNKKYIGKDV
jgi:hypothetical protein